MLPPFNNKHELSVFLFRKLDGKVLSTNGLVSGSLPPDIDVDAVIKLLEQYEINEYSDAATREIKFYRTNTGVFESLDDLLESSGRRIIPPLAFYLANLDYCWPNADIETPPSVEKYLQACRLYSLLTSVADHKDGSGEMLFFLKNHNEKLKFHADYTAAELQTLPGLEEFAVDFISARSHKQQKQTIIRSVLLEIFNGKISARLGDLFGVFPDFLSRLHANYAMYVSEFSFEKIKIEVDKDNLDSTLKLNKVFSDIQGQLLAIPVGLILIGGQMKDAGMPTLENFLIWGAGLIFTIFMSLLIRNQKHSLEAVHKEIISRRNQLKEKSADVAARFSSDYSNLDQRYKNQRTLIFVIDFVVAISFACASFLMLKNSGCLALANSCLPSFSFQ